jgi:hypothetical protein
VYKGGDTAFGSVSDNRGSAMFDAAVGMTIPLGSRWHIEPQVRGGYPHIVGVSLTAGYKFPLKRSAKPSNDIIKNIQIAGFDSIMFGPDSEKYNAELDQSAKDLNDKIINNTATMLKEHPDFQVRIEGHANPVTNDPSEKNRLMALSKKRADAIAGKLREKGVAEKQMVVTAFGGARTLSENTRNINRRVELIVVQVNTDI